MSADTHIKTIETFINDILAGNDDVFLVEAKLKPGNNIEVYLDADSGITIEKCIKVNRALYQQIEEAGLFPGGDFSLEVSSPGVEEPLRKERQYKRNIGRTVEVVLLDDTRKEGKLTGIGNDEIIIEESEGKGKKAIVKTTSISLNQIKHTKVLVTF